jgi:hypothetical protein
VRDVLAIGRRDAHLDAVRKRLHVDHLVPPADLHAQLRGALDQELLDVVLLQIDERRPPMAGLGQEIELIDLLCAEVHATDAPAHALFDQALAAAEAIQDLERALRPADRARAEADGVALVEQQQVDAALREIDRRGQADRPRAHHDHRPAPRRTGELGRLRIGIDRRPVGLQPSSASHISLSRCAVQMRGSR